MLSSWVKSRQVCTSSVYLLNTELFDQASKEKVPETLDPVVLIQQLTKALAVASVRYMYKSLVIIYMYSL